MLNIKRRGVLMIIMRYLTFRAVINLSIKNAINNILFQTENARTFWNFIRKNASCSAIPNTVHWDNITYSGPESISNLFSSYFSTLYVNTSTSIKKLPDIPCFHSYLPNNCEISLIDVENGLFSLNNVKLAGPDGLPRTYFVMVDILSFVVGWYLPFII
jgi:hypothetical protein